MFLATPELGRDPQLPADHITMIMIDEDPVEEDTAHLAVKEDTGTEVHLVVVTMMRNAEGGIDPHQEPAALLLMTTHLPVDDMRTPIAETSPLTHTPTVDHPMIAVHQEITLPESLLMENLTEDDTGKEISPRLMSFSLTFYR